jgi:hypothetical protein
MLLQTRFLISARMEVTKTKEGVILSRDSVRLASSVRDQFGYLNCLVANPHKVFGQPSERSGRPEG